jgi:Carboxypeptidase regulatory-like domain/TonB dependent receptor
MFREPRFRLPGYTIYLILVCLVALLWPAQAAAQAVSGTILGSVNDGSGAAVAGVKITFTHTQTGLTRFVTSDSEGEYVAPNLPPGVYNISTEAPGFKRLSLDNVRLSVDQKARVDLKLEVGATTESVTIEGATPLVQTESSDLSGTVNETQIKNLPLNGRNFVQLTRTLPGVQRGIPGANIDGAGSLAWRASASFAANGMRTRDNNFMLDGVDNNEIWLNSVVIFPSVDALEEFKVQSSTYSAEFGRSSGGVVNIQIKSGQNDFHGSAFEFLRNDALDANNFFNNKNGRAKPPYRQNQFGGTFGGRIRRDKMFFFGDYQGGRIRDSQTFLSTVPSLKMRSGDFSELNRVIYDPLTRQPFAGNVIPNGQFDPAAKAIIDQLYPLPNVAGTRAANGQTINNFLFNPVLAREDDQFDVKIDNYFSQNNHFFGRYSFERTHRFLPATLPHGDAGATFGAGNGLIRGQSLALNDTHTFSPRWLNEARVGFSRIAFKVTSIDAGTNQAQAVGIPGINITDTATAMSQITFGQNNTGNIRNLGANSNQPLLTFLDTFQFFDNVTHTRGAHTLKMGASLTRRRRNVFNVDNIVGQFNFQPAITSDCGGVTGTCNPNPNTGFDFASFVLGYPTTVTRGLMQGVVGERRPEYGAYIQDDWRLSSKLTLNIGLRYDLFVPYVEVYDRQSNFDTSTGRFVVASEDAVINGIEVGRGLQTTPTKDFAPRFGFAYDLFGRGQTVLRGGYGIFWNNPLTGTSSQKPSNPPFLLSNSLSTTLLPTLRLSNGIPAPPPVDPNRVPSGTTRSIFDPEFKDGYAQQWNLNVSQQFGRNYALEVSYVGSKGTHLVVKQDINQAPPVVGVNNADVNRPFIKLAPGLRALSQVQSRGYSNHHAMLVKFSNRLSNGLLFVNSYTFGKTIDIVSDTEGAAQNAYDFNRDRAVSDFDVKHLFTSSWSYDLPFGRGKLIGGGAGNVADKFIGGWKLSGILLLRSGLPFSVLQSVNLLSTGTANRPNRIGSGELDNPTIDRWFDLSAFTPTADNTGTYGNSGRNILRAPGQANVDFSLVKVTRFRERFEHQLKFEFFNAFNHAQFAAPGNTIGNASAGVISSLLFGATARQIQVAMKLSF